MPTLRRYASNSAWLAAEGVVSGIVRIVTAILVARYLGPGDFGILSYTFALVALIGIPAQLGLENLVVRELATKPEDEGHILGTVMALRMVAGVLIWSLIFLYAGLFLDMGSQETLLLIIVAMTLVLNPLSIPRLWFQAHVLARYVSIANIVSTLANAGLKLTLIAFSASLVFFGIANLLPLTLTAVLILYFYAKQSGIDFSAWRVSKSYAKQILSESWIVLLSTATATIYLKIDLLMLKWGVGADETGIYAAAAQLSEATYLFPTAIVASFFPRLVQLRSSNPTLFNHRLQSLFDVMGLGGIVVAVATIAIAPPMLPALYGESFSAASTILQVHILAAPFMFVRVVFMRWVLIERQSSLLLLLNVFGAFMNIVLNIVLIPLYGGIGAAIATSISYAVPSFVALALFQKTRGLFFMMCRAFVPWRTAARLQRTLTELRVGR